MIERNRYTENSDALNARQLALTAEYEDLERQLQQAREDLSALTLGGRWLVWRAYVEKNEKNDCLRWVFRPDYGEDALTWLLISVQEFEGFQSAFDRARVHEDCDDCHVRSRAALENDLPGYTQEFRIRLQNDEISWLSETVHIKRTSPTTWSLTGIAIDVTENKRNEAELEKVRHEVMVQNAELQNMQAELEAQNDELQNVQAELEAQNDELAAANSRLESLATTDGLTGLKNHRTFQETLEHEWRGAKRHGVPLSLIFLDVDRFKQYNDTFGHPAGDDVLKAVGRILLECARDIDCVARYGGEEFVVIAPRTDEDGAMALAERIRERIAGTSFTHREVTASFGVATAGGPVGEMQMLISQADRALYAAKTQGRNVVVHAGGMK